VSTPSLGPALQLHSVSLSFPQPWGGRFRALSDINLDLANEDYVVVIGPNGAGKSTLQNVIGGGLQLDEGRVLIDGRDASKMGLTEHARLVSRVFQDPSVGVFPTLTLEENILLGLLKGRHRSPVRNARTRAQTKTALGLLTEYAPDLVVHAQQLAVSLSGGQRQLVALTIAMAQTPRVLLLDEHTAALDPENARLVMDRTDRAIRENRLTTLMVTHNMRQAAQYGDRLLMMSRGRIVADISASEKHDLGESGLIDRFRSVVADEITDRMLG
jgi:putative tryptophan/tyrosine transport system ATP-binding protein